MITENAYNNRFSMFAGAVYACNSLGCCSGESLLKQYGGYSCIIDILPPTNHLPYGFFAKYISKWMIWIKHRYKLKDFC